MREGQNESKEASDFFFDRLFYGPFWRITFFLRVFFRLGQILGSIFVGVMILADLWQNGLKAFLHPELWLSLVTIVTFIFISQYVLNKTELIEAKRVRTSSSTFESNLYV